MANMQQFEVVAVMCSGCITKAHSTDYARAVAVYNAIPKSECMYKVLWQHVDHQSLDPKVLRESR